MPTDIYSILDPTKDSKTDPKEKLMLLHNKIEGILSSYTDFSDTFAEMLQNSLDSLNTKFFENKEEHDPKLRITLNQKDNSIEVCDNGMGVSKDDFWKIFQPNFSLKRFKKYKSSRGHKGAAITYLQFAHSEFTVQSKQGSDQIGLSFKGGESWFKSLTEYLYSDDAKDKPNLDLKELTKEDQPDDFGDYESGFCSKVIVSNKEHQELFEALICKKDVAIKRIEYLLRTRTGVGFCSTRTTRQEASKFFEKLEVTVEVIPNSGRSRSGKIGKGFFYPHILSQTLKDRIAKMDDIRGASYHLIYRVLTDDALFDLFGENVLKPQRLKDIVKEYNITGYVSYSHENDYYEETTFRYLELLDEEVSDVEDKLIEYIKSSCPNGGWMMSAADFPNGSRLNVLHRGGSESRSRAFVLWNFQEPFRPDYGRKSVPSTVSPFVNDVTKALLNRANQQTQNKLYIDSRSATRNITGLDDAKNQINESKERIIEGRKLFGPFITAGNSPVFKPEFTTESEVRAFFNHLVISGTIKGFQLIHISESDLYDCLCNYEITSDEKEGFIYNETDNKFGLLDPKVRKVESKWLEIKVRLNDAVKEFELKEGLPAKKWYDLVDFIVCAKVAEPTGSYNLTEVTDDNIDVRDYFGITHILQKALSDHKIGVIDISRFANF